MANVIPVILFTTILSAVVFLLKSSKDKKKLLLEKLVDRNNFGIFLLLFYARKQDKL